MTASMKILGLSAFLAIVSLAIPFIGHSVVWAGDADYSFLLQVAPVHLGIAVSSIIGGYAGALHLHSSQEKTLHELAIPMSFIAIAVLIGGCFTFNQTYIFMYVLACPPLVGFGIMQLSEWSFIKKRGVTLTLIVLLLLPSIALFFIGVTSQGLMMVVDLGTGFRVLFGALIGGLALNLRRDWKLNPPASEITS